MYWAPTMLENVPNIVGDRQKNDDIKILLPKFY